jgi:hypothetical protein
MMLEFIIQESAEGFGAKNAMVDADGYGKAMSTFKFDKPLNTAI